MGKSTTSFKPGVSGNAGGRPKLIAEVRELAGKQTTAAIKTLVECMASCEEGRVRVAAASAILDRAIGKPTQAITGEDGGTIKVDNSAGLLEILKRLAGDK